MSSVNSDGGRRIAGEEDARALRAAVRAAQRARLLVQQEAAARALAALDEADDDADVNDGAGGAGDDGADPEDDGDPAAAGGAGQARPRLPAEAGPRVASTWKRPAVRDPDPFSGVPGDGPWTAVKWCGHVRSRALYAFPPSANQPEEDQVAWAATYLEKLAADWWQEPGVQAANRTWTQFERSLRARFQPEDLEQAARARLAGLTQGVGGLQKYISSMQTELSFLPDMNEKDKVAAFNRGLLPAILEGTMRRQPRAADLHTAIAHAVAEDALLAELAAMKAQRPGGPSGRRVPQTGAGGGAPALAAAEAPEASELLAALAQLRAEVAAMRAAAPRPGRPVGEGGRRLSPEERQRRFASGACFFCAKVGHRAAACPDKPRVAPGGAAAGAGAGAGAVETPSEGKE